MHCSVKETDWRAELRDFRQAVADDTQLVQQRSAQALQVGVQATMYCLLSAKQAMAADCCAQPLRSGAWGA